QPAQSLSDARDIAAFLHDFIAFRDTDFTLGEDVTNGATIVFRLLRDKLDIAAGEYVLPVVEGAK
ncbi:hypothetical protein LJC46_08305, partial [Desulfovibrio sp. OttesenSCG-928-G15]|nr:hypothetical protein [Desulfovibrio sp. OttesenSCG-928-G15]